MGRKTELPATGSDRALLAAHLTKIGVWKVLFLYIHGTIDTATAYRRLDRIGVAIEPGQVGQLADLAFADAKPVGAKWEPSAG